MGREVVLSFYDPQAAGLAPSALRGLFINADGSPNGSVVSAGFASVNSTPDQYVWAGECPPNFSGLMQFSTVGGRTLGVSEMPAAQYGEIAHYGTGDIADAVWQYALPSGSDAGAAVGYMEEAASAAAVAANEAKDAAIDALNAANNAGNAVWHYAEGIFQNVGLNASEVLDNIRSTSASAQSDTESLFGRLSAERAAKLDTVAQVGSAMTLTPAAMNATADAILDHANGVEQGLTLRQHLRIATAVLFGKATVSGNQVQFKRRDGSTTAVSVDFSDTGARPNSQIGSV